MLLHCFVILQEKIEMQKELLRLEKLMAMVSEALHQKEGGPSREIPPMTEHSCRDTGDPVKTLGFSLGQIKRLQVCSLWIINDAGPPLC